MVVREELSFKEPPGDGLLALVLIVANEVEFLLPLLFRIPELVESPLFVESVWYIMVAYREDASRKSDDT
jgi:hypothetical protein